jgi:hypothetical protein
VIVFFNGGCLAGFFKFSSSTLEPDLPNSVAFSKTSAPQPRSPSSFAPTAESLGHIGRWCPARGMHELESFLLFGARDGHALPSLAVHGVGWGLRWNSLLSLLPATFFLGFFCFVLCIPFVSSSTVCLCIAQILLEFLLARC